MSQTKELTPMRDPAIRYIAYELFKKGNGYKRTSTILALKQQTVRDWFRMFRCGHPETVFSMRRSQAYDETLRNQILADHCQNQASFAELSAKYGVPAGTIRKWVKRFSTQGSHPIKKD